MAISYDASKKVAEALIKSIDKMRYDPMLTNKTMMIRTLNALKKAQANKSFTGSVERVKDEVESHYRAASRWGIKRK